MKNDEVGKQISVVSGRIDQFIKNTSEDMGVNLSPEQHEEIRYCTLLSIAKVKAKTSGDKSWLELIEKN